MVQGVRGGFKTSAAQKVLGEQFDGRLQQLEQLRDEYKALYAETSADPATANETIRNALMRAQALDDTRPIQEAVLWTQSLRDIVTEHRQQIEGA